ncbi:Arginase [Nonomuraea coxensis DSM 45129]|uniref:Arginase n=1 Tax=Nonomuraea coxensis DSM 45129 TaxID=1122611 RepID=A0ABX8UDR2_9ACTN|nr:arginase family protein [Nonomuraea coxensis]QYC45076.1 Arginase [Nonomuraea coxensis DSM 45129]
MALLRKVAVVEVPQWRGSGARTAERLREGARVVAELVEAATARAVGGAAQRVRVAVEDSDLGVTAARVRAAVDKVADDADGADGTLVVAVGGDCGVELEPVSAARRRYGDRLVVVWFDAHGDLNTPESSPSGAYHGMVLRALTGEGPEGLTAEEPLDPRRIVLAGVRDLDPPESAFVTDAGIRWVTMAETGTAEALLAAIEAAGGPDAAVYVHIDLDVLDPDVFLSVGCPTPGGMHPERLLSLVTAIGGRFEVAGLGLMEYEAGDPGSGSGGDRDVLAEVVGGVVAAVAGHPGRTVPR